MPIQTDLSVSPYFDDFDENKDYYRVLFKPGVAVQVRELNQLQSILQKQIERFGDNIYKKGSIIDGCNFVFYNPLPYVKINDLQVDSAPVNVSAFDGYLVKNSSNLVATIVKTIPGYEATSPDLNTLYLKYLSGGNSGETLAFSRGDILTVYDPALGLSSCTDIIVKSSGFSNTDTALLVSAIVVQNSTGGRSFVNATGQACTFVVGEIITQEVTNARAEIRQVNTTAIEGKTVLSIRPLASELRLGNTDSWSFKNGIQFSTSSSKITANLTSRVGGGATASIITDVAGGILTYTILNPGSGYIIPPYATVYYSTPNTNPSANVLIDALNVQPKNYKSKVVVNSAPTAVGNGYGFGVSAGVIYQKGYFSRVNDQFVVVEKYSTSTNNIVGFDTSEQIIDYRKDFSLTDNATGGLNLNAPGANRLKLTPELKVLSKAEAAANDTFFGIVEFSDGKAFKRNNPTVFNSIAKELARRTYEQSGNYVTDGFLTATISDINLASEVNNFKIRVDPGTGYLNGYRVQLYENFNQFARKGITTERTNTQFSVNYGNYIVVNELGGIFKFSIGASISLYDAPRTYITSSADAGSFGAITTTGNEIGKARIRSLVLISGVAGEPNARYQLYLFDIKMNSGKNFDSVRSVYYNGSGSNDGIADVILYQGNAKIFDPQNSSLVFSLATKALKNASNVKYVYRTIKDTLTCNTEGYITTSVAQTPGEALPYQSTLSDAEKLNLILIPSDDGICANSPGSVIAVAACTYIMGTSTNFSSAYEVGDYVRIANSTAGEIKRVTSVINSTAMVVAGQMGNAYSEANISLIFPKNVPIPLYLRNNRVVTVEAGTTLKISLGNTINSSIGVSVAHEVTKTSSQIAKTVTRKTYVKINPASHIANNTGPWCLGIPDIIRLRGVYQGNSSAATTSDINIADQFWIDHNQRKDFYDIGYLYKKSNYELDSNKILLIEFDMLSTSQNGLKTVSSYPINDTLSLNQSASTINTVEIPEMYHDNGDYYDLRDIFDFRPYASNTCDIVTTSTSAPTNPSEPEFDTRFDVTTDKKFPAPKSECSASIESYKGRVDAVLMTSNTDVKIVTGVAGDNPAFPDVPKENLLLNYVVIPPYPSLPIGLSDDYLAFLDRRIANINVTNKRQKDYSIKTQIDATKISTTQPQRYTMEDIAKLEKRISDLEYYTTLSMVETKLNQIQIPSSSTPSINRAKFGYFADDFTTTDYAELNDPTYSAQIFGYQLHPLKRQLNIKYGFNLNDAKTVSCINGTKILLPSTRKRLITQNIATEPTTIEVAITETVSTTTGTEVTKTETKLIEVTTTEFRTNPRQVLTSFSNAAVLNSTLSYEAASVRLPETGTTTQTKAYGHENITTSVYSNSTWQGPSFSVSKLGGTITAGGTLAVGSGSSADGRNATTRAPYPKLQQYKNNQWVTVATAVPGILYDDRDGNGSVSLPGYDLTVTYVIQPEPMGSNQGNWALDYTFSADINNTLYRIVGGGTPNGTLPSSITRGTYPRSVDVTITNVTNANGTITTTQSVPLYQTQYTTEENKIVSTKVEQKPLTEIVEDTVSIPRTLFSPRMTGMITIDNIFSSPTQLNDPFVDLAKYIQSQLNS